MNCSCKIGGPICGVCRGDEARARGFADMQRQLLSLAARVVTLEETVLSQARVLEALGSLKESDAGK